MISGDSGGTAEALRAGETGVLVDCRRADTLAAAVAALLSDPQRREHLGVAGRQWTARACSFAALAPQMAAALQRIGAG